MSEPVRPDDFSDLLKPWLEFARAQEAARQREAARRAQLTPEQRRADDEAEARKQAAKAAQKLERKIRKYSEPYRGHERMFIHVFACLVHGVDPAAQWSFFPDDSDAAATAELLKSCVGVSLHPLSPSAREDKQLLAVNELLSVARTKQLAGTEYLATALAAETRQPPAIAQRGPAPQVAPAPEVRSQTLTLSEIVRAMIERLIQEYERISKLPIDRTTPLLLTHKLIYEHVALDYRERGRQPPSEKAVQRAVSREFRLRGGNPDNERAAVLMQLRPKPSK